MREFLTHPLTTHFAVLFAGLLIGFCIGAMSYSQAVLRESNEILRKVIAEQQGMGQFRNRDLDV